MRYWSKEVIFTDEPNYIYRRIHIYTRETMRGLVRNQNPKLPIYAFNENLTTEDYRKHNSIAINNIKRRISNIGIYKKSYNKSTPISYISRSYYTIFKRARIRRRNEGYYRFNLFTEFKKPANWDCKGWDFTCDLSNKLVVRRGEK